MTAADCTALAQLDEDSILANLEQRFHNKDIYTFTSSVLLAVNPYEDCASLYSEEIRLKYAKRDGSLHSLPPHAFAIAAQGYQQLFNNKKRKKNSSNSRGNSKNSTDSTGTSSSSFAGVIVNPPQTDEIQDQAVIISGESGAGKTETAKILMRYLCTVSRTAESEGSGIQEVLYSSNSILESFGNATTLKNNNSSRFGKYSALVFNVVGHLLGCEVKTYLLESSRVVGFALGERTYHVFYEMLAGCTSKELKEKYHLEKDKKYKLLYHLNEAENPRTTAPRDDRRNFKLNSLADIGFDEEDVEAIFKILAGMIMLGEIEFVDGNEADSAKIKMPGGSQQSTPGLLNTPLLKKPLLGVNNTTSRTSLGMNNSLNNSRMGSKTSLLSNSASNKSLSGSTTNPFLNTSLGLNSSGSLNGSFTGGLNTSFGKLTTPRTQPSTNASPGDALHPDLEAGAKLLGMNPEELQKLLLTKTVHVKSGNTVETIIQNRRPVDAKATLHSLLKLLYSRVFSIICKKINAALMVGGTSANVKKVRKFSILDIYGFECFEKNDFEQLCINLANERLQEFFLQNVLEAEQKMYQREGIKYQPITLPSSEPCLEKIGNIFSVLDDHNQRLSLKQQTTEEKFTSDVLRHYVLPGENILRPIPLKTRRSVVGGNAGYDGTSSTPMPPAQGVIAANNRMSGISGIGNAFGMNSMSNSRTSFGTKERRMSFGANDGSNPNSGFIISHYAGDVTYTTAKWLQKNNSNVLPEIEDLLIGSTNEVVENLQLANFPELQSYNARGSGIGMSGTPQASPAFTPRITPRTTPQMPNRDSLGSNSNSVQVSPFGTKRSSVGGPVKLSKTNFRDSVTRKYLADLDELMAALSSCNLHYIRTFKPNVLQQRRNFNADVMREQLRCSGTIQLIKIMHDGYPHRCAFAELAERFQSAPFMPDTFKNLDARLFVETLLRALGDRDSEEKMREFQLTDPEYAEAAATLAAFELKAEDWTIGTTRLFLKAGKLELLESFLFDEAADENGNATAVGRLIVSRLKLRLVRSRWNRALTAVTLCLYLKKLGHSARTSAIKLALLKCVRNYVRIMRYLKKIRRKIAKQRISPKVQATVRVYFRLKPWIRKAQRNSAFVQKYKHAFLKSAFDLFKHGSVSEKHERIREEEELEKALAIVKANEEKQRLRNGGKPLAPTRSQEPEPSRMSFGQTSQNSNPLDRISTLEESGLGNLFQEALVMQTPRGIVFSLNIVNMPS